MTARTRVEPGARSVDALTSQTGRSSRPLAVAWFTAIALFVTVAAPTRLAAQKQPDRPKGHTWYTIKDLGTLGGPSSFFSTSPIEPFVDNGGIVVGEADTREFEPLAPNCLNPDCHARHGFQWQNGVMTDLGTLPGGIASAAFAVNQ